MKFQVAVIKINEGSKLSVVLQYETEEEERFLTEAFDSCPDFDLSMSEAPKEAQIGPSRSSGP